MNGFQKVIRLDEKVIKLNYFRGAVVMVFSDPLFPLTSTRVSTKICSTRMLS